MLKDGPGFWRIWFYLMFHFLNQGFLVSMSQKISRMYMMYLLCNSYLNLESYPKINCYDCVSRQDLCFRLVLGLHLKCIVLPVIVGQGFPLFGCLESNLKSQHSVPPEIWWWHIPFWSGKVGICWLESDRKVGSFSKMWNFCRERLVRKHSRNRE